MSEIYPETFKIEHIFFGGGTNRIELEDHKYLVFLSQSGFPDHILCQKKIRPKEAEWIEFWKRIDEIDVWNWKEDYNLTGLKADGDKFNIIITLEHKNIATSCHCNAPEGFDEFFIALENLSKLNILDAKALK